MISRFRQAHENGLAGLFVDVLRLCAEAKLVKVGLVALDGTKIKANAALAANRTHAHLAEEVKKMLAEAEEKASGKKKCGRKPKDPDPTPGEAKANVTDPPSRIMKTRKGYEQAYNAQAATTEEQIIVVAEVTQDENDQKQYHPMIKQAATNLEAVGVTKKIGAALADAGYWSKATMAAMTPDEPDPFIATTKDWKQRKAMRRGLSAADSEWKMICATHNLLKLFRSGKATWN